MLYSTDEPVHRKFRQQFPAELEQLAQRLTDAHNSMYLAFGAWPRDAQADASHVFLMSSLNSLFVGSHFLVSGYRPAAGQQIRAHFESLAIALLVLIPDQWREFDKDPSAFPAHRAVHRAASPRIAETLTRLVRMNPGFWKPVLDAKSHYNHHSHGGAFSARHVYRAEWPNTVVFGGEFDQGLKDEYRADIKMLAACAKNLPPVAKAIGEHLRARTGTG